MVPTDCLWAPEGHSRAMGGHFLPRTKLRRGVPSIQASTAPAPLEHGAAKTCPESHMPSPLILGLNSTHPDSSAVLLNEKGIIAAIAEERINRKKHCAVFPGEAIAEVLRMAGAGP